MEDIVRLKKMAKIKLIVTSLGLLLPLLLLIILEIYSTVISKFEVLTDLLIFRYAIFIILEVFLIYKIYTYISIGHNEEYANKFLIAKNDERNSYIKMKTNSKTVELVLYFLGIGLISTAFTQRMIFYTLLAVFICFILTYLITRLWYSKKF